MGSPASAQAAPRRRLWLQIKRSRRSAPAQTLKSDASAEGASESWADTELTLAGVIAIIILRVDRGPGRGAVLPASAGV